MQSCSRILFSFPRYLEMYVLRLMLINCHLNNFPTRKRGEEKARKCRELIVRKENRVIRILTKNQIR